VTIAISAALSTVKQQMAIFTFSAMALQAIVGLAQGTV